MLARFVGIPQLKHRTAGGPANSTRGAGHYSWRRSQEHHPAAIGAASMPLSRRDPPSLAFFWRRQDDQEDEAKFLGGFCTA